MQSVHMCSLTGILSPKEIVHYYALPGARALTQCSWARPEACLSACADGKVSRVNLTGFASKEVHDGTRNCITQMKRDGLVQNFLKGFDLGLGTFFIVELQSLDPHHDA